MDDEKAALLSRRGDAFTGRRRRGISAVSAAITSIALVLFGGLVACRFFTHADVGLSLPAFSRLGHVAASNGSRLAACAQPDPLSSFLTPTGRDAEDVFSSPSFANLSAQRLIGAIRIPTQVYDDMGDPRDERQDERWQHHLAFHEYLRRTFPAVHERFSLAKVNKYALVYTWRGSEPDLKPILLAAHQDVVPVQPEAQWTYPPFEAVFDGEWVWGRGAADCKSNLIGILSSLEYLLVHEPHFQPRRTILLAFGSDEEAHGYWGAAFIAKHLEQIWGTHGVGVVVDEGGSGVAERFGRLWALPAIAEKGYADVRISVDSPGGHSSVPSRHTSIGLLSRFIVALEDAEIYEPTLTEEHPLFGYLQCVTRHASPARLPKWLPRAIRERDFSFLASKLAEESESQRYRMQTSKAATMTRGGVKVNALPEHAEATFNSRIDVTSSVSAHMDAVTRVLKPVADRFGLDLYAFGAGPDSVRPTARSSLHRDPSRRETERPTSNVTLTLSRSTPVSPLTDIHGETWMAFARAVIATFGTETVTAPSLMTGNTDTKHYWNITKTIYRWTPAPIGTRLNSHTVDERVMLKTHIDTIRFYYHLVKAFDRIEDDSRL